MKTHTEPIRAVSPIELMAWIEAGRVRLVDVREPAEHAGECISGACLEPLSRFDDHSLDPDENVVHVLYCRTGRRSAEAASKLLLSGWDEVHHLEGGLDAWKAAGLTTDSRGDAPMSLERQVRVAAGSLVVLGSLLGLLVSPWFHGLSMFVGAGLTFAGLTDTCGMAMVLARMPWNQRVAEGVSG